MPIFGVHDKKGTFLTKNGPIFIAVLRKSQDKFWESGIIITPIPVLGKNENCQKLLGLLRRKCRIGSKIGDKGTVRQKAQGKNICLFRTSISYKIGAGLGKYARLMYLPG